MKRIWEDLQLPISKCTRSQKRTLIKETSIKKIKKDWISATEFDNFCLNDPIIDWFNELNRYTSNTSNTNLNTNKSLSFLFERGRLFEDVMIQTLREKTGISLDKQTSLSTSRLYNESDGKKELSKTIDKMKRGDYLIYSAYLSDHHQKLRGIPDLLIRNDYVDVLFPTIENVSQGKSIFGNYYYLPIEIKFSTMTLAADGIHLLNEGRNTFYKTQLYTYCTILNHIQHFQPSQSFIIGKRTIKNDNVIDSLELPARIDFNGYDQRIPELFRRGLKWLRDVKQYAVGWKPYQRPELIPNMKIDNDRYYQEKKYISSQHGEITELWQCGVKNREMAFSKGIFSSKDIRLSSDVMNISSSYKEAVDKIIKINRGELGDYYPKQISKNINNFQAEGNEMFVDFETVRDSFDITSLGKDEYIFLIGVYYKGEYQSFRIKRDISLEKEKEMINDFINFWKESGKPKCWYWYAEKEFWRRAILRHPELPVEIDQIKWVDLYQVIKNEPFVVKGATNFKLKSYVKSLINLGKINLSLPPVKCTCGLDALLIAYQYYYRNKDENNKTEEEMEIEMKDIIDYNRFDCEALYQILTFLRTLK